MMITKFYLPLILGLLITTGICPIHASSNVFDGAMKFKRSSTMSDLPPSSNFSAPINLPKASNLRSLQRREPAGVLQNGTKLANDRSSPLSCIRIPRNLENSIPAMSVRNLLERYQEFVKLPAVMSHTLKDPFMLKLFKDNLDKPIDGPNILSIPGNGSKGLIAIMKAVVIEKLTGKPICESYDVIGGVSIGSWIAVLLSLKIPAEEIFTIFAQNCSDIFSTAGQDTTKYGTIGLRKVLSELVGERTLLDVPSSTLLLVFAYDIGAHNLECFNNWEAQDKNKANYKLIDIMIASASATSFFPTAKVHRVNIGGIDSATGISDTFAQQIQTEEATMAKAVDDEYLRLSTNQRHKSRGNPSAALDIKIEDVLGAEYMKSLEDVESQSFEISEIEKVAQRLARSKQKYNKLRDWAEHNYIDAGIIGFNDPTTIIYHIARVVYKADRVGIVTSLGNAVDVMECENIRDNKFSLAKFRACVAQMVYTAMNGSQFAHQRLMATAIDGLLPHSHVDGDTNVNSRYFLFQTELPKPVALDAHTEEDLFYIISVGKIYIHSHFNQFIQLAKKLRENPRLERPLESRSDLADAILQIVQRASQLSDFSQNFSSSLRLTYDES